MLAKNLILYFDVELLSAALAYPLKLVRIADNMTLEGVGKAQLSVAAQLLFENGATAVVATSCR